MKKLCLIIGATILAASLVGCGGEKEASAPKQENIYINIGTGGTAGTYYPLGGAFAEIWNNEIDGVNATAESTGASVANVNMLQKGDIDIGVVQNDIASYAETGTELFKEKVGKVRGMTTLYNEPIQCITTDDDIKSIHDLRGKKVAIGAIGSGTYANAVQIMEAAGITLDDINAQYLSFAEAATGLKDRQIDAGFIVAGIPTSAIVDLSTQRDVRVVNIDEDLRTKLKNKYSYYTDFPVEKGIYSTQTNDATTLTVQSMLIVSSDVKEDLVYKMLKSMFENQDRIKAAHKVGEFITAETGLNGMSVELHPGAKKYFKEKGILK